MSTIRLTMAQAVARFLTAQKTEIDGTILPLFGGYTSGTVPGLTLAFIVDVLKHAILPAASLILVSVAVVVGARQHDHVDRVGSVTHLELEALVAGDVERPHRHVEGRTDRAVDRPTVCVGVAPP